MRRAPLTGWLENIIATLDKENVGPAMNSATGVPTSACLSAIVICSSL